MVLIPASSLQLIWTSTAQSGAWGPPLLGAGFLYRILSPTDWLPVFTHSSSCERHNFAFNSTCPRSRLYPDIPRPDTRVIYTGAFPILTAWLRSICYKVRLHFLSSGDCDGIINCPLGPGLIIMGRVTTLRQIVISIGLMSKVFTNGQGEQCSMPGQVIPKTQKIALDAALLNSQQYKVRIKGKLDQFRELSSVLPYTIV